MQIVIDINDEDYKRIQDTPDVFNSLTSRTYSAIRNGTPLPKGHGRLIDRDKLELDTEWDDYYDGFASYSEMQIRVAPIIIDADKEEKND